MTKNQELIQLAELRKKEAERKKKEAEEEENAEMRRRYERERQARVEEVSSQTCSKHYPTASKNHYILVSLIWLDIYTIIQGNPRKLILFIWMSCFQWEQQFITYLSDFCRFLQLY